MKKVTSRIFFALIPPRHVADALHQLASGISETGDGRPVNKNNLHLTLRFIGPVNVSVKDCLISSLSSISFNHFKMVLNDTGFWKRSGIFWCAPESTDSPLIDLVQMLEDCCQQCGLPTEKRPYKPHITLLRKAKEIEKPTSLKLPDWDVESFALMESISTGRGVSYKLLKKWLLV